MTSLDQLHPCRPFLPHLCLSVQLHPCSPPYFIAVAPSCPIPVLPAPSLSLAPPLSSLSSPPAPTYGPRLPHPCPSFCPMLVFPLCSIPVVPSLVSAPVPHSSNVLSSAPSGRLSWGVQASCLLPQALKLVFSVLAPLEVHQSSQLPAPLFSLVPPGSKEWILTHPIFFLLLSVSPGDRSTGGTLLKG